MRAVVGAQIVVRHNHADQPEDRAVILEVRGPDGEPSYLVQWRGPRHPSFYLPGPDAHVSNPIEIGPPSASRRARRICRNLAERGSGVERPIRSVKAKIRALTGRTSQGPRCWPQAGAARPVSSREVDLPNGRCLSVRLGQERVDGAVDPKAVLSMTSTA